MRVRYVHPFVAASHLDSAASSGFDWALYVLQTIGKFERRSGGCYTFVLVLAQPLFDHRFPRWLAWESWLLMFDMLRNRRADFLPILMLCRIQLLSKLFGA